MKTPAPEITVQMKRQFKIPLSRNGIKHIVATVLQEEDARAAWEIECLITDDVVMRRLNSKYRGQDETTDVLSFALTAGLDATSKVEFPSVPGVKLNSGQIVVSYPRTVSQAREHNHSVTQELILLLVHSTLHLVGYEHAKTADAKVMRQREQEIIKLIDITGE